MWERASQRRLVPDLDYMIPWNCSNMDSFKLLFFAAIHVFVCRQTNRQPAPSFVSTFFFAYKTAPALPAISIIISLFVFLLLAHTSTDILLISSYNFSVPSPHSLLLIGARLWVVEERCQPSIFAWLPSSSCVRWSQYHRHRHSEWGFINQLVLLRRQLWEKLWTKPCQGTLA